MDNMTPAELSISEHVEWIQQAVYRYITGLRDVLSNTFDTIDTSSVKTYMYILCDFFRTYIIWPNPNMLVLVASAMAGMIIPMLVVYAVCQCVRRQDSRYTSVYEGRFVSTAGARMEALRWFKQGELDKEAARHDMYTSRPAFEWVCFKCQQGVEKCLKATVLLKRGYRESGDNVSGWGHDLVELAKPLKDKQLNKLATELQGTIGIVGRMRYPDSLPYPQVPRDVYTRTQAVAALKTASLVINHIKDNYISVS